MARRKQFGQSPLAFALQEALGQAGDFVGSIPELKQQNRLDAQNQQDSELARALKIAQENRAQGRFKRNNEAFDLEKADRLLGLRQRGMAGEQALNQRIIAGENQAIQGRAVQNFAGSQGFSPTQARDFQVGGGSIPNLGSFVREDRLGNQGPKIDSSPFSSGKTPPNFVGQIRKAVQGRSGEFTASFPGTKDVIDTQGKRDITQQEFNALSPFISRLLGEGADDSVATVLGLGESPAATDAPTVFGLPPGQPDQSAGGQQHSPARATLEAMNDLDKNRTYSAAQILAIDPNVDIEFLRSAGYKIQ